MFFHCVELLVDVDVTTVLTHGSVQLTGSER